MHYPKKLREATAALVAQNQLLVSYIIHYGRIERNHPLVETFRNITSTVAFYQMALYNKNKIKNTTNKDRFKKIKKLEPKLQKYLNSKR